MIDHLLLSQQCKICCHGFPLFIQREIVTLHFGQAGVQMGNATWELLCLEHGINEQGKLQEEPRDIECLETFFSTSHRGDFVPRSVYIDLEPTVIDEVRRSSFRDLFHPDRLISGPEDAASNFARGFFTVGKLILNSINHELRRIMEGCDNVHGLMIFRGLGGGTGSGLTSAIFDNLAEYPKTYKLEIPIYPSPTMSTSTVEAYNSLLAQHFCMEDVDIGLLFDNEAIYDICTRNFKKMYSDYTIINRLIAQLCSNLTVSIRFENTICSDLSVLQTNLVPYPRIHFPVCSFAPMVPEKHNSHISATVDELTRSVFNSDTQMMHIDNSFGRSMSCALSYRGDVSPHHVYKSLMEMKNKKVVDFVDWCPTGFRVGINVSPPVVVPDSCLAATSKNVTLLMNTSAIGQAWQRLTHKFYMLYSKKSFVHWFVAEGMEECEFTESLYNISSLVKDYEECVLDLPASDETERNIENTPAKSDENNQSLKQSVKQSVKQSEKSETKKSTKSDNDPAEPKEKEHHSNEDGLENIDENQKESDTQNYADEIIVNDYEEMNLDEDNNDDEEVGEANNQFEESINDANNDEIDKKQSKEEGNQSIKEEIVEEEQDELVDSDDKEMNSDENNVQDEETDDVNDIKVEISDEADAKQPSDDFDY